MRIQDVRKRKQGTNKYKELINLLSFIMENERQILRKVVSDVSQEMDKFLNSLEFEMKLGAIDEEVEQAECQCCGLKEECTTVYIMQVKECFCGNWICGLCAEAVKEGTVSKKVGMQDALKSHRDFCQRYSATTRLNPKLSLTLSMREIARRSSEKRKPKGSTMSKLLGRSSSYP